MPPSDLPHPSRSPGSRLPKGLGRSELCDERVLAALAAVPREQFIPSASSGAALEDRALPIGCGQTISQPYIVALMTQEARIRPGDRVLEIGTGSGYQAAVLSEIGAEVYSIEIIPELADSAKETLNRLGCADVHLRHGDGRQGWPEAAPFDAILVTAAAEGIPDTLLSQLGAGGRLIVPVRRAGSRPEERLIVVTKTDGEPMVRELCPVRFVPLTGGDPREGAEE
ncbi:MAG: protein-L-isoaspartate(D-aspartate) O-methyltransferase [Bdellovibrionales bacterium]|nr:protein-L-isoaspartate(D-aspartate) O-methyltransferase [Bdellovibrionales bacterium]